MAFISKRKSIRWGDEVAGENTSTVVLTSRERWYVDVRIYISDASEQRSGIPGGLGEFRDLECAFAGTSRGTPAICDPLTGELTRPAHTVWTRWVDSQTFDQVMDEGYMYPQPDGTVLEKGEMVRIDTGKMTRYEEVWEDYCPVITGTDEKIVEVILNCEDVEKEAKGVLARIGGWIQAILRSGKDVTVVRWQWIVNDGDAGEWRNTFTLGSGVIPCQSLFSGGGDYPQNVDMRVGVEVSAKDGMTWICRESHLR